MVTSHRHTQSCCFPANSSPVHVMEEQFKHYQKHSLGLCNIVLWASSWSLLASPHQEQERVVRLILRWMEHMKEEVGWMGDAGRGDHWMAESPDVSFRLRGLLGGTQHHRHFPWCNWSLKIQMMKATGDSFFIIHLSDSLSFNQRKGDLTRKPPGSEAQRAS